MKHGLMYYLSKGGVYKNIGDYIQSLAAEQFIHGMENLVEREHLHEYQGEKLKMILNGWFMHQPENFPPSSDIEPLFVSFHINPKQAEALLRPETVEYLKKYAPIGCRDQNTVELLKEKGVDAYFSGCLTLTLGETYQSTEKLRRKGNGRACLVDPYIPRPRGMKRCLDFLFYAVKHPVKIGKIYRNMKRSNWKKADRIGSLKLLLYAVSFYRVYSKLFTDDVLLEGEYINHSPLESSFKSEKEKFDYADYLLKKYAASPLVITSRIHCALPCTAMGARVCFVNNSKVDAVTALNGGRLEGLVDFFNIIEIKGYRIKADFAYSPKGKMTLQTNFKRKCNHVPYAEELVRRCREFVAMPEAGEAETQE